MFLRIRKKVSELHADQHMREVVRGSVLGFLLKILGSVLSFALNIAIARLLGAEGVGLYFLALSVTTIGTVIGRIGLDNALLRFVAINASIVAWDKVKGYYALGMQIAIIASVMVTIVISLSAYWLAVVVFKKPELEQVLQWMSLSVLPLVLLNLHAESLKGLKLFRNAMMVQSVGLPLGTLLLLYPLVTIAGLTGAIWSYTIAAIIVALLGIWAWQRHVAVNDMQASGVSFKELRRSCVPLFFVSLVNTAVLPWGAIFVLGIWESSEDVGVYSAASRTALLMVVLLQVVNSVLAPKFAELYLKQDMQTLAKTARGSALAITILVSPIFLVLFFGSEVVMKMFGQDFVGGSTALSVLVLGQFVNVVSGSVGTLLIMSGHEEVFKRTTMLSALVLFGGLFVLVPCCGLVGAAVAQALALSFVNVVSILEVKKHLGIMMFPFMRSQMVSGGGK